MWVAYAIAIHVLLLGSVFVIYFRSPVITGLQPQRSPIVANEEVPAKRVVLIVTDGLRAESFFKSNCEDIPYLRKLMLQQPGIVGISRTHVPTESRPGHIALIAGLYEDPSAVTRGWKENPIDFDTVFNRSARTYAWGANDVLHIFSRITSEQRMIIDAYDHDLDFSGSVQTYKLDEWVFNKVKFFLSRKATQLQEEGQVIYFLHLLGLDTAGHVHKPNSALFLENLHRTERGIWEIYEKFEEIFPDRKTVFVLTSDHGMTNSGSHGAGNPHETETPFYIWGSGVENKHLANNTEKTFLAGHHILPLHEIEQAQIAPFISAVLGLPPPMNNFGILPKDFLNASLEYKARAVHCNALQLLHQFQALLQDSQSGFFSPYLRSFEKLGLTEIDVYHQSIEKYYQTQQYEKIIISSYNIMTVSLEGIDYYHSYYKNVLLFSTTITMIGWILYLYQLLLSRGHIKKSYNANENSSKFIMGLLGCLALVFVVIQKVNWTIAIYLLMPILIWWLLMPVRAIRSLKFYKLNLRSLFIFSMLILCVELFVLCFFKRHFITVAYLLYNFYYNFPKFSSRSYKFYVWLSLVLMLATFPLLPPSVGYKNDVLLLVGAFLNVLRSLIIKSGANLCMKTISYLGILNGLLCIYQHSQLIAISLLSQIFSWLFLLFSIITLFFDKKDFLKYRVELILFNLSAVYIILCTSYEPIFLLLLSSELLITLSADQSSMASLEVKSTSNNMLTSFRLAFAILLYTFFSFFGTGNIASVSSFDPNIIRCFLTTFSPFIIMFLVILKLLIPVVINISIVFGVSAEARDNERQIFICLLIICDLMGLNFLYLVRNRGSWLEIGSSISHFVIMEVTTVVLLLLTFIAKIFLRLPSASLRNLKVKK